jgi:hypothetical protein
VHDAATQQLGQGGKITGHVCSGCKGVVSSNVTRLKGHLMACNDFLDSSKARELAPNDPELRAHVERRCVCAFESVLCVLSAVCWHSGCSDQPDL